MSFRDGFLNILLEQLAVLIATSVEDVKEADSSKSGRFLVGKFSEFDRTIVNYDVP